MRSVHIARSKKRDNNNKKLMIVGEIARSFSRRLSVRVLFEFSSMFSCYEFVIPTSGRHFTCEAQE